MRAGKWTSTCASLLTLTLGVFLGTHMAYIFYTYSTIYDYQIYRSTKSHNEWSLNESTFEHGRNETFHRMQNTSLADELFRRVRVLCWVVTAPENHESKAKMIKATWGKRCNELLFMSSTKDSSFPTIGLPVAPKNNYRWEKTRESLKYIHKHHIDDADWYLKVQDDTYVIMENLRYMLLSLKTTDPAYYGCKFRPHVRQGFISGGAGYVLSRAALERAVEIGIKNGTENCALAKNDAMEDEQLGLCLESLDVKAVDARDSLGRTRFFPAEPQTFLLASQSKPHWVQKFIYNEMKTGMDCCSDNAISFKLPIAKMLSYEYYIYHLRPYGISYNDTRPEALGY